MVSRALPGFILQPRLGFQTEWRSPVTVLMVVVVDEKKCVFEELYIYIYT